MLKHVLYFSSVVILLTFVFIYLFQRNLIYFPDTNRPNREDFDAEDMQVVHIKVSGKLQLQGWYKPALINQPTLLYLHGNGGHIGYRMYLIRQFLSRGFGVLLFDYRGYGGNPGRPTEQGLYEDAEAAVTFLQEQGIKPNQLILYGESLGTGVAVYLASNLTFCSLILQSPYISLTALAKYHYPFLLISPKDKFNSLERIKKIHVPILFLHGKQDVLVPFSQGKTLFEQANEPKHWIEFEDRGHHNLWDSNFVRLVNRYIEETSSNCLT